MPRLTKYYGFGKILTNNSLFGNSFYLMLATFVLAGFGFVFWAIVTRSYDTETVGLATTLLSVSTLISMLGLAGFDTTFVRYLPKTDKPGDHISTGLATVGAASLCLSVGYLLILPLISPSLSFVTNNPVSCFAFIFFTVATSLNTLTNAIFLAHKDARDIFWINIAFSLFKITLPIFMTGKSPMFIFILAGLAQIVGAVISLAVISKRFDYKFSLRIYGHVIKSVKKYSLSVYVSSILNLLPPTILPLIIVKSLGPESVAYYYMAFTIASVLYTISYSTMQSAFTEGSHNESNLRLHITKALKLIGVLLLPATAGTMLLGGSILQVFGADYTSGGSSLLQIFALAAFGVASYSALGAVFKVTKNLRGVIAMNIVYAFTIIILSYMSLPKFGLNGVGWSWLLGNISASLVGILFLGLFRLSKVKELVYGKIASSG